MERKRSYLLRKTASEKGLTLMEMLVVIAIIIILSALALPSYLEFRRNIVYRDVTRDIVSFMRNAKNQAIVTNREQRLEFDGALRRYGLRSGDRVNSTNWLSVPVTQVWIPYKSEINMNVSAAIDGPISFIVFNPNGTVDPGPAVDSTVTIVDTNGTERFRVRITPSGRISIERREVI